MIEKNTVLILGAGASCEYGYPLATSLKMKILEKVNLPIGELQQIEKEVSYDNSSTNLNSVILINKYLIHECKISANEIYLFKQHFGESHNSSIDAFLESRKEYLKLGKLLIAMSIYECESEVLLFRDHEKNWYKYLMKIICQYWDNFSDNKLSIITYNYDRSLEHFLINDLASTFNKNNKECINLLNTFPFIHVHGKIDNLPYTSGKNYSGIYNGYNIEQAHQNLHIVFQEDEVSKSYIKVHEVLNKAENIFILGFGYDERNLQRLELLKQAKNARIFSTRTGITNLEIKIINKKLNNRIFFSKKEDQTIINFFREEVSLTGETATSIVVFNSDMQRNAI